MTPKEKAKDLIEMFENLDTPHSSKSLIGSYYHDAKQCALICVDEILKELKELHHKTPVFYWQEVKQEIENL